MDKKLANGDIAIINEVEYPDVEHKAIRTAFYEGEFIYSENKFPGATVERIELMVDEINFKFKERIIKEGRALRQSEKDNIINAAAIRMRKEING